MLTDINTNYVGHCKVTDRQIIKTLDLLTVEYFSGGEELGSPQLMWKIMMS